MDVRHEPAERTLHLVGTLDVRSVAVAREALDAALRDGDGDLVLDVSGLDALDAAGLGVVVATHRKAVRRGRRLVLRGASPALLRTLAVTRLLRILNVERLVPA